MKQPDKKDSTARNMAGVAYGELIRSSRREKGMSQEELGALARVGKIAVGKLAGQKKARAYPAAETGRPRLDRPAVYALRGKAGRRSC